MTKKPKLTVVPNEEMPGDGRVLRSERSRQKIIDAMLALIDEGDFDPSAQAVAERAGVGLRSVFRRFEDMDTLYSDCIAHLESEMMPIIYAPYKTSDWRVRLNERIDRRVKLYERIKNVQITGRIKRYSSPVIAHDWNRTVKLQRSKLEEVLPDSLLSNSNLVEALDVAMSFDTYLKLRQDSEMSTTRAKSVIKDMVWRLINS